MPNSRHSGGIAAVLSAVLLTASVATVAAAPSEEGSGTGDVFADLVEILRDANGVPLLKEFTVPSDIDPVLTEKEYCVQPMSTSPLPGGLAPMVNPADGRTVYPIPLMGDPGAPLPGADDEVEVCDPQPAYAMYVAEAELERLNMARQPDEVKERKLNDVAIKLMTADETTLDGAGRITVDGIPIDASPEHAAIYRSLMTTGTIPGIAVEPIAIDPFDVWMLAAASMGAASGKYAPISIDSVQYYNRIVGVAGEYVENPGTWEIDYWRTVPPGGEQFVDFSGFSYTRADVFKGCATWLDVSSLTWEVSSIDDLARFGDLPPVAVDGTVGNVAGFAQLADDVRSVIVLLHENEVVPGFMIDRAGENTCAEQTAALTDPAVNWGVVPADMIETDVVPVEASVFMPWAGETVEHAQVLVTIDATEDFAAASQVTAVATDGSGSVAFTVEGGNLVGRWGPVDGFPITPGYSVTTEFDITVADGAPLGSYDMTLDLVDLDAPGPALATDSATTTVHDAVATVLWTSGFDYAAQGTFQAVTARVFNPDLGQDALEDASLRITVDAPEAFILPTQVSAWSEAVPMNFTLDTLTGDLVGTWPLMDPLPVPHDELITWFINIAEGTPTGVYEIRVELVGSTNTVLSGPAVEEFIVAPAAVHGGGGGGGGGDGEEPALPAVASIVSAPTVITDSASATFVFDADQPAAEFACSLDGAVAALCASPVTYTDLADGPHVFAVYAVTDKEGPTAVASWTVDTIAPALTLDTGPDASTTATNAAFTFSTDGAVTALCSLDGAPLTKCTSPVTYSNLAFGNHTLVVAAVDAAGNSASLTHVWTVVSSNEDLIFTSVTPTRVADTRAGWVAADGEFTGTGPVAGGSVIRVQVSGRAGVPAGATAAMLNLTIANPAASGFATVYACGTRPETSSVNFLSGSNVAVANEVMVQLSPTGGVCVYVHATAEVIVDAVGEF